MPDVTSESSGREEVRKVQFSGKSSFMLALPKRWVTEMNLKAGDQVTVSRRDDTSLLIVPKSARPLGSKGEVMVEVAPDQKPHSITRRLISTYLLGYNQIRVRGTTGVLSAGQRAAVKETMRKDFIGTEVIADSAQGTTLQVLLSYPELDVKTVVKRMFSIATSMHRDAINAVKQLDGEAAAEIIRTDDEVDRFSLYAIRQLNIAVQNEFVLKEIGLETRRDCLDFRVIVKSIERVADHATRIAEAVEGLDAPLERTLFDKLSHMSEFAVGLFEEAGLALFKEDYGQADRVVEQAGRGSDMQRQMLDALDKLKSPGSSHVVPLVIEDLRRTADYAADIAEIVINMITQKAASASQGKAGNE